MSDRVRIHEAGHCLALLARGFMPNHIRAAEDGAVHLPWGLSIEDRSICHVAGAAAERLLLNLPGELAGGDLRHFHEDAAEDGRDVEERLTWATAEAESIVLEHEPSIRQLAAALVDMPVMRRVDLRNVCAGPGPLNQFHHLFPGHRRSA